MVRDIFGSILYLSLQKKVDMAEVLKYPLTPVPLALSHVDGTMQKTTKASLMKSKVVTINPTHIDTTIIVAMFFLHLQSKSLIISSKRYVKTKVNLYTSFSIMKVVNITNVMIKLQFKLPQALISRGFTRRTVFHAPAFQQKGINWLMDIYQIWKPKL